MLVHVLFTSMCELPVLTDCLPADHGPSRWQAGFTPQASGVRNDDPTNSHPVISLGDDQALAGAVTDIVSKEEIF